MENPLNWKNSIVLVPFPFDDLSATKVRPALCLTERLGSHDHVVVAFITKIGRKAPAFTPGDRSYPKGYISPLAREGQKFLRVLH